MNRGGDQRDADRHHAKTNDQAGLAAKYADQNAARSTRHQPQDSPTAVAAPIQVLTDERAPKAGKLPSAQQRTNSLFAGTKALGDVLDERVGHAQQQVGEELQRGE